MDYQMAIRRAKRALREDGRLYLVAVSSLAVAFLCLATSLLVVANLSKVAERWGASGRMSVYLRDGAQPADVEQLRMALEGLPEVRSVKHVTAAAAREDFLREADVAGTLGALPPDVFPASLEVTLGGNVDRARAARMNERLSRFAAVDQVETYRGFFDRIESLLAAGQSAAFALAILVVICVLAVVGNTIRLAVAGRREEVEVLKLCGATDGFVRTPFVLEGALQGLVASALAVLVLLVGYLLLRGQVDDTLAALTGVRATFLSPLVALGLVLGGGAIGALGSAVSLRRYLAV